MTVSPELTPWVQLNSAGRARDVQFFAPRQPLRLQEGEEVGDVVEVVVGQEDVVDGLVADVGPGEPVEDAAPAVDEQWGTRRLDE